LEIRRLANKEDFDFFVIFKSNETGQHFLLDLNRQVAVLQLDEDKYELEYHLQ